MNLNKNNIQPSFLLKGLNIADIHKRYKQGYFNRPIPVKKTIKLVKKNKIESHTHSQQQVYAIPYKTIQLSGQKYVELYTHNKCLKGGRCDYCKLDFTTDIIGYPISYEEERFLTNDNIYQIKHLFWTEGCFDSYGCCLAYINKLHYFFNEYNLEFDVKVMFKYMYSLLFGDVSTLKPAQDSQLLVNNGGSMTLEAWSDLNVIYERTNEVIKIPAQVIYNKI